MSFLKTAKGKKMDFSVLKTFRAFIPLHGDNNMIHGLWAAQKDLGGVADGC